MSASADLLPAGRWDVVVAGAGPAGSIAAREMARTGLKVLTVDRLVKTAPKLGETLPGAALRLLERLGLEAVMSDPEQAHCPVGGSLVAWSTRTLTPTDALNDPAGRGRRLDRHLFDGDLRQACAAAGVVRHSADVVALTRMDGEWAIGLDDGTCVRAGWIVDATGRRARVARLLGRNRRRSAPLVALYRTGMPSRNVALDRTILEAGADGWIYAGRLGAGCWVFGYHTSPRNAVRLRSNPADHLADAPAVRELLGEISFDPAVATLDASSGRLDPPCGTGWIACGDAALSFDPIAGQGLFNALRTGMAAAKCIIGNICHHAGSADYNDELTRVAATYADRRHALYQAVPHGDGYGFWRLQAATAVW